MSPPRFSGPTHPCPRCGEVAGDFKGFRAEHLAHVGWRAYRVESYQNWCGHGQEVLTWPQSDGDQPDPGYAVWVSCRCGARLEQWVTRADAESDLLRSALLAFENTTV